MINVDKDASRFMFNRTKVTELIKVEDGFKVQETADLRGFQYRRVSQRSYSTITQAQNAWETNLVEWEYLN